MRTVLNLLLFANKTDYLFGPVACKKDSPVKQPFIFAKDHQDEPAPCKDDGPVRQPLLPDWNLVNLGNLQSNSSVRRVKTRAVSL